MKIRSVSNFMKLIVTSLCILKLNGASTRDKHYENVKNLDSTVNIGISDASRTFDQNDDNRRHTLSSELPRFSESHQPPESNFGFHSNKNERLTPISSSHVESHEPPTFSHAQSYSRHGNFEPSHLYEKPSGIPLHSSQLHNDTLIDLLRENSESHSLRRGNKPSHSSSSKQIRQAQNNERTKFSSNSKRHNSQSNKEQINQRYDDYNQQSTVGILVERPNYFDSNHEKQMKWPKSNEDTHQDNSRVPSQFSGQDNYYGNNGKVVRQLPGQSGYHSNEEGISSVVDSFNGNVNDGSGRRRSQVHSRNSGSFNSQENSSEPLDRENGYRDIDNYDSDRNKDNTTERSTQTEENHGRRGEDNTRDFSSNRGLERSGESIDHEKENGGIDGNDEAQSRRTGTSTGRNASSDESDLAGANNGSRGLSGNSRYTTARTTTTEDYYDVTTTRSRANRRKRYQQDEWWRRLPQHPGLKPIYDRFGITEAPTTTAEPSSSGCYLPEQPQGGRYELGGCDSPCDKEPGDAVPNTSVLTYTCASGFVRNGSAVSVCLNDTWYMPPSCLKTCPPLKSSSVDVTCKLRGSTVACDELVEPGTRAKLACKQSYKIPLTDDPAYREITCQEDGQWDRRLFKCLPKCGSTIAHGNTLVVNGFTAKVGVFPWHVGIYEKKSRHVYEQICAGTLINSNLVVSAAHCFWDESTKVVKEASHYYVAVGKHNKSWDAEEDYVQKSRIDVLNIPDRYMGAGGNFAQDIALVKISKPFELTRLVQPVCLDWDNVLERDHLQAGKYGKTVGWGKTANGQASEELQEINLPFIPFDQCSSNVPQDFRGYITPDKFCAGYTNGSSLCEGDSGGGLCFVSNGLWYLRGIVSVGPVRNHTCDENAYTAFTYFSHFRDWVRNEFVKS